MRTIDIVRQRKYANWGKMVEKNNYQAILKGGTRIHITKSSGGPLKQVCGI